MSAAIPSPVKVIRQVLQILWAGALVAMGLLMILGMGLIYAIGWLTGAAMMLLMVAYLVAKNRWTHRSDWTRTRTRTTTTTHRKS